MNHNMILLLKIGYKYLDDNELFSMILIFENNEVIIKTTRIQFTDSFRMISVWLEYIVNQTIENDLSNNKHMRELIQKYDLKTNNTIIFISNY